MATPTRYVSGYWDGLPDDDGEGNIADLPTASPDGECPPDVRQMP